MGRRILIIDDNASTLGDLARELRASGLDVYEATGVQQALDRAADRELDLAVVDLMMPGVAGIQLVRRLQVEQPELPILLVCQYRLHPKQVGRIRGNVVGLLPKPVASHEVLAALDNLDPAAGIG